MSYTKDFVLDQIKERIGAFNPSAEERTVGKVLKVADGVATLSGLGDLMMSEIVEFVTADGLINGVALNLELDTVGAIILGSVQSVKEGDQVRSTGRILSMPVAEVMVGRVLDSLGQPLDGGPAIKAKSFNPVEKIAPGVMARAAVKEPLQTGIKAIDAMVPIGRGQRELIIGDRQIGKTSLAIDTIINQKGQNIKCIYVAIAQKESKLAAIVAKLQAAGAMDYTTIILAGASAPASMVYLAPYSGCALAEYFLAKGEDVLIVYDDLSKHAVAYRELSLLLRRSPGREAYPGDVFYLHSRLLERACKLNAEHGGGSITALPIIETQAGDVSAYIPTNVISITDGQIYLETDSFYKGNRPAINAGLSVSRVGGSAQIKAMRKLAGHIRLEAAQFRELAAFSQFGSDLDEDTKRKLERGKRLVEVFKQNQYAPLSIGRQLLILYALTNNYLNDVPVDLVRRFESELYEYLDLRAPELAAKLETAKELDPELDSQIKQLLSNYKDALDYLES